MFVLALLIFLLPLFFTVRLFFSNIIIFDCILLAVLFGLFCFFGWKIHPALCLVIGIVVFLLLFILHNTRIGFWAIGGIMTLSWGVMFGAFAYDASEKDWIWAAVVFVLAIVIVGGLHFKARNSLQE